MSGLGDAFDPSWRQVRQAQASAFKHAAQSKENLEFSFVYLALRTLAERELEKVFPHHPLLCNIAMVEKLKVQAERVCALSDPVHYDDARAFAANYPLENGITSPRGIMSMKKFLADIGEIELSVDDYEKIETMGLNDPVKPRDEIQRAARELAERRESSAAIKVMQEAHPEVAQAMIAALPPLPPKIKEKGFFASLFGSSEPAPPPPPAPIIPPGAKILRKWHNGKWVEEIIEAAPEPTTTKPASTQRSTLAQAVGSAGASPKSKPVVSNVQSLP